MLVALVLHSMLIPEASGRRDLGVIKALVTDFDGPIFDAREARDLAYRTTLETFGGRLDVPPINVESTPLYGPTRFMAVALASSGANADLRAEVLTFYRSELLRIELSMTLPRATRSWLDELRRRSISLCILTGRLEANIVPLVENLGLSEMFDMIVGQDTVPNPKPEPDGLRYIAEHLKIPDMSELLMLGDSDVDFAAASRAGVGYLHAGWSREPNTVVQRKPSVILKQPSHLLHILTAEKYVKPSGTTPPSDLAGAIDSGELGWFAGAGVSISSGLGSWEDQYLPLLSAVGIDWITDFRELPEALQLGCVDLQTAKDVFTSFRSAFGGTYKPNGYHLAIVRSKATRIWTSNYDQLFERAISNGGIAEMGTVYDDDSLLDHFADGNLVIKVNGDFERGRWDDDLDWHLVATQEQFDKADNRRTEIWRLFEDDFRNRSLVFVGVSLQDPVLRRIITIAAGRVPRTRHRHYILTKIADDVIERALQRRLELNLLRYHINTIYFSTFPEILKFAASLTSRALRPIVGVSGDTDTPKDDPAGDGADAVTLSDGQLNGAELRTVCSTVGRVLAEAGYRVTSGGAPYVGIDVVNSAFAVKETLARFYLRRGGRLGTYQRTAPVVIVNSPTYDEMRRRFVGEVTVLLAIGGRMLDPTESGVVAEIDLALARRAPVLLFPQAGGAVAAYRDQFLGKLRETYADPGLAEAVTAANIEIGEVAGRDLESYLGRCLVGHIENVVNALVQADVDAAAARRSAFPEW